MDELMMNGLPHGLNGRAELVPPADAAHDEAWQARRLMSADIHFQPTVFTGTEFPALRLPTDLEDMMGPHTVRVTYYDQDYSEVASAARPGRYGAVVEIRAESGHTTRRYRTLYRAPQEVPLWRDYLPGTFAFPEGIGVAPQALDRQAQTVGNFLKGLVLQSAQHDSEIAALLAGLHEIGLGASPTRAADDVWARDRQWWVGLKRRIEGTETAFPHPFSAPRPLEGLPAATLRDGSASEAGVAPDAAGRLDALCREWAADSDQGFTVCAARGGAIFFEGAYGTRRGHPMTPEVPSWMASITKLLAGSLLAMLLDQNLVSLDAPVGEYLPALRGLSLSTPLTLRHLMTHTAGLWGHLGDEMHDFEYLVADFAPYLSIGKRYDYNGTSLALAGKVIEAVTGEALPQCFARHLLHPLGAYSTDVSTMSWNTFAPARDIARVGQMLLNRGAYGQWRFFGDAAYQALLPQRLTQTLGPDATEEYGLGTSWFRDEGLGEGTFGHGAASASTLRIDPQNGLVIVMARNDAGANFDKYHPQFLRLVGESVAPSAFDRQ